MKKLMNTMPSNIDFTAVMTSREIAEITGKAHRHVTRDILVMLNELELDASTFGRIYLDTLNRKQTEYVLDWELTMTLITGYSIKLRNAVIKRLQELVIEKESWTKRLERVQRKEAVDKSDGSFHGRGLAHRKKTKRENQEELEYVSSKMQLTLTY